MAMDKGNKVTTGATLTGAFAAVLVWIVDELMGIPMSVSAATGIVVLAGAAGAALSDWLTADD